MYILKKHKNLPVVLKIAHRSTVTFIWTKTSCSGISHPDSMTLELGKWESEGNQTQQIHSFLIMIL